MTKSKTVLVLKANKKTPHKLPNYNPNLYMAGWNARCAHMAKDDSYHDSWHEGWNDCHRAPANLRIPIEKYFP